MVEITAKTVIVVAIIAFFAYAFMEPESVQNLMNFSQDSTGEPAAAPGTVEITDTTGTGSGVPTQIIAIASVNFLPSMINILNESYMAISPGFLLWRAGASEPVTVAIAAGAGTQSVAPGEVITVAAGTNNAFYWDKVENIKVGTADTPWQKGLYTVASGLTGGSVKMFDSAYNELTAIPATQVAVSAGQTVSLQAQVDTTSEYTAVRRPHICVDYNTSNTRTVKVAGLTEVDAPTRLIASLDQCFYTGIDYLTDNDPKLLYDISYSITSGEEPTNLTSGQTWHIIDQDMWFQDGEYYFINPLTNADMGQVFTWNTTFAFA